MWPPLLPWVQPNPACHPQAQECVRHLHCQQRRHRSELDGAVHCAPSVGPLTNTAIGVYQPRQTTDPEVTTQLRIGEMLFVAPLTPYTEAPKAVSDRVAMPGSERKPQADDGSLRELAHTTPMLCGKLTHEPHGTVQRIAVKLRSAGRHPTVPEHRADEVPFAGLTLRPEVRSGQWKRYAISRNKSTGLFPLPCLSPCAPLCHPLLVKGGFDGATGNESDPRRFPWNSIPPGDRIRGDEITNRMVPRTLVRAVPNRPGVPFLAVGKNRESPGYYLLDRTFRTIRQPHP